MIGRIFFFIFAMCVATGHYIWHHEQEVWHGLTTLETLRFIVTGDTP